MGNLKDKLVSNINESQTTAEFLPPLDEKESRVLAPLAITTPLQTVLEQFDEIAAVNGRLVEWASKIKVVDAATRDQAIMEGKMLARTAKLMEERRLAMQEPIKQFITDFKAYVDAKRKPFLDAVKLYDEQIVAYAVLCKQREDEEKARILTEQKAVQDRIDAERRERETKELQLRIQEEERVKKIEAERRAAAEAQGQEGTAQFQSDIAGEEELARIEGERAERERKEKERQAEEENKKAQAQQAMAVGMTRTKGTNKVKGISTVWAFEIVNEAEIPRQFLVVDETKIRKYLQAGLADGEKDPMKRVPGARCWEAVVARKGGH